MNNTININQYIEKKSRDDAILHISKYIYKKLSKSSPTAVAFLNCSKASDTVNQDILLSKMSEKFQY